MGFGRRYPPTFVRATMDLTCVHMIDEPIIYELDTDARRHILQNPNLKRIPQRVEHEIAHPIRLRVPSRSLPQALKGPVVIDYLACFLPSAEVRVVFRHPPFVGVVASENIRNRQVKGSARLETQ